MPANDGPSDPDIDLIGIRSYTDAFRWTDLLDHRRVVILAEAGSGKTTELEERARSLRAQGRHSFFATIQNVGSLGVEGALISDAAMLAQWRTSRDPAWFFLDSIDEAKDRNVPLKDALAQVARAVKGADGRAHIVLSGRHGDWEFRRDLERLATILPVPAEQPAQPLPDPNDHLVRVMRRERIEPPLPAEQPLIVLMAALDRQQVATFARAKGIPDVEPFLKAIDASDLWRFARRPIDLQWLVDYWRTNGEFGLFQQMLDASLRYRLQEPNPDRERSDELDAVRARLMLERIGAALVLQKKEYLLLPDTALALSEVRSGLDVSALLDDLSARDRCRLLNRAAFDPVVAGLTRLHHDNEGVVRSYLAAKWLKRLRDQNCPLETVMDLLFATTYEMDVVIPSMRQTTAWLSLWDAEIAQRVLAVDPQLLIEYGDPASLPLPVRRAVLEIVVGHLRDAADLNLLSSDSLQRFSRPDLAPAIGTLWKKHKESPAVRRLLLTMIWLGTLRDPICVEVATFASFGRFADRSTQVHAGRALMAVGSAEDRRRYLDYLLDRAAIIDVTLIADAIEQLFATTMSVDELFRLLERVDLHDSAHRIDFLLGQLPERFADPEVARKFAAFLLSRVDRSEDAERELDDTLVSAAAAAAKRELELSLSQSISEVAITSALLAIAQRRRSEPDPDLLALLFASPERRRAVLYHAAPWFAGEPGLHGQPVDALWQFRVIGLHIPLNKADLTWLITDADMRTTPAERRLAADAWMSVVYHDGVTEDEFAPIRSVALRHPEVAATVQRWTDPPTRPESPTARELRRVEERNSIEQAQQDEGWRRFADEIRRDPAQLRAHPPLADGKINRRLAQVWTLLKTADERHSSLAIDSLDSLAPIFDDTVRAAIGAALMTFWRHWTPRLRSARAAHERTAISNFEMVGLTSLALEARTSPDWATCLSHEEALLAVRYASLEINGFPPCIDDLARAHPDAVRQVLTGELAFELSDANTSARTDTLDQIARAGLEVGALVVAPLEAYLHSHAAPPYALLRPLLQILSVSTHDRRACEQLLGERIERENHSGFLAIYFQYYFRHAPAAANAALEAKLARLAPSDQTKLVEGVLPRLVGDDVRDEMDVTKDIPLETLERLVIIAYRTIRREDDNDHSDGRGYTPDDRDDAESARSALFARLFRTPGRATVRVLRKLMRVPNPPAPPQRLESLRRQRAAEDSEADPWTAEEVRVFELDIDHLVVPHTPADLQRIALGRIRTLHHQLLHAEFNQGATLACLEGETAVQLWIADRFEQTQGRSYSVERESVVAGEKAPDIRLRAKASTANLPIEVKVAESWPFSKLQDALDTQLVKQYLRDPHNRFGILLLVHQKPRRKGWQLLGGRRLTIQQAVSRLQQRAATIAAARSQAPQPAVVLLDVSSVCRAPRARKALKKKRTSAKRSAVQRSKTRRGAPSARKPTAKSKRKSVKRSPKRRH